MRLMIHWEHSVKKSGLNGMAPVACLANIRLHGICDVRNCGSGGGRGCEPGGVHVVLDAKQA